MKNVFSFPFEVYFVKYIKSKGEKRMELIFSEGILQSIS